MPAHVLLLVQPFSHGPPWVYQGKLVHGVPHLFNECRLQGVEYRGQDDKAGCALAVVLVSLLLDTQHQRDIRTQGQRRVHVPGDAYHGDLLLFADFQDGNQLGCLAAARSQDNDISFLEETTRPVYRFRRRKESRRQDLHMRHAGESPEYAPPDRGEAFRISEEAERAVKALRTLSLREQQLVVLKIYEEKSYREISEITGFAVSKISYLMHAALKSLRDRLGTRLDLVEQAGGEGS